MGLYPHCPYSYKAMGNFHLFTINTREGTSASYYIYVGIILTNKEKNTYSDVVQLMFKFHKEISVQFILGFVYYKFHDAGQNGRVGRKTLKN